MTNKKYIIGIVVIVLVILGWLFLGNRASAPSGPEGVVTPVATTTGSVTTAGATKAGTRATTPSAPAMTKSGAYIVSYTSTGFSPATVTIKRGKSVHFVNNSNKAMSLTAVDQYSQIYREFNQEQSVGRSGFYDFTFVTGGIWVYTNRNYRADRGTIIVE